MPECAECGHEHSLELIGHETRYWLAVAQRELQGREGGPDDVDWSSVVMALDCARGWAMEMVN